MTIASSYIEALADPRKALDTALENPKGIRLRFKDKGVRTNYRYRLYRIRKLDRKHAREVYGFEHGEVSPYDALAISFGEDKEGLYLDIASVVALGKGITKVTSLETGKRIKV